MIITIINVSQPVKIKTYYSMEVNYKNEQGSVQGKKLMSFLSPNVFNLFKEAQAGEQYDVTSKKKGEYWQWEDAKKLDGVQSKASVTNTPSKSNYETSEEREKRQRLIVRQSSLTNAVAILSVGAKALKPEDVKVLANQLTDWVFEEESLHTPKAGDFDDLDNDFPV